MKSNLPRNNKLKTNKEEWKDTFDYLFFTKDYRGDQPGLEASIVIKDFISHQLQEERRRVVKEIKEYVLNNWEYDEKIGDHKIWSDELLKFLKKYD